MTSALGDVDEESLKTIHWTHQPQLLSISHLTSDLQQFDIVARSDKVAIQLDGDNLPSALDKLFKFYLGSMQTGASNCGKPYSIFKTLKALILLEPEMVEKVKKSQVILTEYTPHLAKE
ncbi:unnamed protein product [Boreogadus saida]